MYMKKIFKIYALLEDETVRYIGVTSRELKQRLYQHIWDGKNKIGSHKIYWIKSLLNNNKKPSIKLIEECTEDNWQEREKYWISFYNNLTNTQKGGLGVIKKDRSNNHKKKQIVSFNLENQEIKIFNSCKEASEVLNCKRTAIGNVLKGRSKTARGFFFCSYQNYLNNNFLIPNQKTVFHKPNSKIIQITNGIERIWNSTNEASNILNIKPSTIKMSIYRGTLSHGSYWKYLD